MNTYRTIKAGGPGRDSLRHHKGLDQAMDFARAWIGVGAAFVVVVDQTDGDRIVAVLRATDYDHDTGRWNIGDVKVREGEDARPWADPGEKDGLINGLDGKVEFVCPRCLVDYDLTWCDPVDEIRSVDGLNSDGQLVISYTGDHTDADSDRGHFFCGRCQHEWGMSKAVAERLEWV